MLVRRAGPADVAALWPDPLPASVRAVVMVVDGERVALAGIAYHAEGCLAFARVLPAARAFPWAIYKGARMLMEVVERRGLPVMAVADPAVPRAADLLEHLGFTHINTRPEGEVYQWTI